MYAGRLRSPAALRIRSSQVLRQVRQGGSGAYLASTPAPADLILRNYSACGVSPHAAAKGSAERAVPRILRRRAPPPGREETPLPDALDLVHASSYLDYCIK